MRLQLSMLLLPRTARENFWAAKLTSLVAFEQLKIPIGEGPPTARLARAACRPATVRSSARRARATRHVAVMSSFVPPAHGRADAVAAR